MNSKESRCMNECRARQRVNRGAACEVPPSQIRLMALALAVAFSPGVEAARPGDILPAGVVPSLRGVVSGAAVGNPSATATGNRLVVDQSAQRAIIEWNSFNIGAGSEVRFNQ